MLMLTGIMYLIYLAIAFFAVFGIILFYIAIKYFLKDYNNFKNSTRVTGNVVKSKIGELDQIENNNMNNQTDSSNLIEYKLNDEIKYWEINHERKIDTLVKLQIGKNGEVKFYESFAGKLILRIILIITGIYSLFLAYFLVVNFFYPEEI